MLSLLNSPVAADQIQAILMNQGVKKQSSISNMRLYQKQLSKICSYFSLRIYVTGTGI